MSLIHSMLGEAQSFSAPPAVAGDPVNRWSPYFLSILRIVTAFVYGVHGTQKLFGFPAPFPVPHLPPLFFGALLLLIGLLTRPIAFVLSGEMAVAYFKFHAPQGFWPLLNDGEGAVLYCFIFLFLASAGGGSWSLDRLLRKRASMSAVALIDADAFQRLAFRAGIADLYGIDQFTYT